MRPVETVELLLHPPFLDIVTCPAERACLLSSLHLQNGENSYVMGGLGQWQMLKPQLADKGADCQSNMGHDPRVGNLIAKLPVLYGGWTCLALHKWHEGSVKVIHHDGS